jgi:hypothetical protein
MNWGIEVTRRHILSFDFLFLGEQSEGGTGSSGGPAAVGTGAV